MVNFRAVLVIQVASQITEAIERPLLWFLNQSDGNWPPELIYIEFISLKYNYIQRMHLKSKATSILANSEQSVNNECVCVCMDLHGVGFKQPFYALYS